MKNFITRIKKWLGVYKPEPKRYHQNWKCLIDEFPSDISFESAWKRIFGAPPDECDVRVVPEGGFIVCINDRIIYHPGFFENTDEPFLLHPEDLYTDSDASNWDYDMNGERYWKLSMSTNLPRPFLHVKSYETIRNYIVANPNNKYTQQWRGI